MHDGYLSDVLLVWHFLAMSCCQAGCARGRWETALQKRHSPSWFDLQLRERGMDSPTLLRFCLSSSRLQVFWIVLPVRNAFRSGLDLRALCWARLPAVNA